MGRPRMKIGEWGNVATTAQVLTDSGKYKAAPEGTRKADRWRARAKVRDADGIVRDVERYGATKTEARRVLEESLRERVAPVTKGSISGSTTFEELAQQWAEAMRSSDDHAANTKAVYSSVLNRYVLSGGPQDKGTGPLAGWTVREVNVAAINRALASITADGGPAVAKTAKTVLSSVMGLAVRHGAIPANPVREADRIKRKGAVKRKGAARDTTRAFTLEERDQVMAFMDTDPRAQTHDLGDLIAFLAGTGARLGEACALRWSRLNLDGANPTASIDATLVRLPGVGLVVQEETKTHRHASDSSRRVLLLPPWLADRLLIRRTMLLDASKFDETDVVFPSPMGKLRDPSNTTKTLRTLLDRAGFGWATSHTFRKTAATLMDQAHMSAREIAGQLGHANPSLTTDVYMDRRPVTTRAAEVL